jgi:hypothetical protein
MGKFFRYWSIVLDRAWRDAWRDVIERSPFALARDALLFVLAIWALEDFRSYLVKVHALSKNSDLGFFPASGFGQEARSEQRRYLVIVGFTAICEHIFDLRRRFASANGRALSAALRGRFVLSPDERVRLECLRRPDDPRCTAAAMPATVSGQVDGIGTTARTSLSRTTVTP